MHIGQLLTQVLNILFHYLNIELTSHSILNGAYDKIHFNAATLAPAAMVDVLREHLQAQHGPSAPHGLRGFLVTFYNARAVRWDRRPLQTVRVSISYRSTINLLNLIFIDIFSSLVSTVIFSHALSIPSYFNSSAVAAKLVMNAGDRCDDGQVCSASCF